jgi:2-methylcitrate dehydratase PrpD
MNATPTLDEVLKSTLDSVWSTNPLDDARIEQRARELLLDTIGCALAGFPETDVTAFVHELAATDPGPIRIPGMEYGLSASGFMFAFSAAACCFEGPEGLAIAHGRPGLHAVTALLAHAHMKRSTLREVLGALAVGYEIGGQLGITYRIRPGMHVDGTWGTFGAAAALASLHKLTPQVALDAINHAACQLPFSLYFPISQGSTARNVYVGHGAVLASVAIAAARSGLGGPTGGLAEHTRLLLGKEIELPSKNAGNDWLILNGYLKKYPITKHVHYGIYPAALWREQQGVPGKNIERVRLRIYREAMVYCGVRAPTTSIQAQFSLSYGVAWALLHGGLTTAAFAPEALVDPEVRRIEAMVEIVEDPELSESGTRGATLEVTVEGELWSRAVAHVPGDAERPLTRDELVTKFNAGAIPVIGAHRADEIAQLILDGPLDVPLLLPD